MDTISIIVPVYNVKDYLRTCIDSLLAQQYKNLEIILVDDGSNDGSAEICDQYARLDSRVIVIHKKNGGLSEARNAGLHISSGQYIMFVDSDDYVSANYVANLHQEAKRSNHAIVECHYQNVYGTDCEQVDVKKEKPSEVLNYKQWFTQTNLGDFLSVVVWNKIYRADLFDGVRFSGGRLYEDDSTTYKLIYKAKTLTRIYERLYYYRHRTTSITGTALSKKKIEDNCLALQEQIKFFDAVKESALADFSKARLCLLLISYYVKLVRNPALVPSIDTGMILDNIKHQFRSISNYQNIPFKYFVYIRMFMFLPILFTKFQPK